MAYTTAAHVGIALHNYDLCSDGLYMVTAFVVSAYIVMAYIFLDQYSLAYRGMAYMVTALYSYSLYRYSHLLIPCGCGAAFGLAMGMIFTRPMKTAVSM